jgi:hypothetical protein
LAQEAMKILRCGVCQLEMADSATSFYPLLRGHVLWIRNSDVLSPELHFYLNENHSKQPFNYKYNSKIPVGFLKLLKDL